MKQLVYIYGLCFIIYKAKSFNFWVVSVMRQSIQSNWILSALFFVQNQHLKQMRPSRVQFTLLSCRNGEHTSLPLSMSFAVAAVAVSLRTACPQI